MFTDVRLIADAPPDAERLAARALSLLKDLQTGPSPVPYTVAYVYLANLNGEIRGALQPFAEQGSAVPEKIWRDLYEQHILGSGGSMSDSMSDTLQRILNSVSANISDARRSTDDFSVEVRRAVAEIDATPGRTPDVLLAAAKRLLTAAESTCARAGALQAQLEAAMADAEQLRVELEEQRRAATIDPLTGLLNRRGMDAEFEALLQVGATKAFSVLMVDIDRFKAINDSFGHSVGDALIRNVAQAIRACIRKTDHAVRYGGEEFLVILPETTGKRAMTVAEAIRTKVGSLRLVRRTDNMQLPAITVSIGVASSYSGDDADAIVNRADRAMYQSKQEGRNQVTCA